MSAKNELQEYFQSRKKNIPRYYTEKVGGTDHKPLWVSEVYICDGRIFRGGQCSDKRSAEFEAAENALLEIKDKGLKKDIRNEYNLQDRKVAILVDMENRPKFLEKFSEYIGSNGISVIGFISESSYLHGNLEGKDFYKDDRIKIITIPSTRSDGADIGMTFFAGMLLSKNTFASYIVVSGDHFAEALADCIRSYSQILSTKESESVECYVVRSFEKLHEKLKEF